jgi:membrane-associated phospholipid phosphatase
MRIFRANASARAATLASLVCLLSAFAPPRLTAQQAPPPPVTQQGRPLGTDTATAAPAAKLRPSPIFTSRDLVVAGALVVGGAALISADASIAREFQRPGPQSSATLRGTADGVEMIASPGALLFGGSLYAVGIVARRRAVADFGWHTLEALAVSAQVTTALKGLFGRARPYAASGDAQDFAFAGGFSTSERRSFPSGHTSAAFTLASVVAEESSHRWPSAHRFIAPLAYTAATGVGLARMYKDKHWASDVAIGAAIGTVAGRVVVRYGHGRTGNWVDRIALWAVNGR